MRKSLKQKVMVMVMLLVFVPVVHAVTNTKIVCQKITATQQGDLLMLTSRQNKPVIYLIKNISSQEIWLDRVLKSHASASAGWGTSLKPGNWSALQVTRRSLLLSCQRQQADKLITTNCSQTIDVCRALVQPVETGSFWLSEDKSKKELEDELVKRLKN